MEEELKPNVPYIVHESEIARLERINKRFFALVLVLIVLLVATNAGWLVYESQFEETVITQDVDTGEAAAYVTGIGDVYGTSTTDSQNESP